MKLKEIKQFRDTYKGKKGVIIDIYLDNDIVLHQNQKNNVIIWNDTDETIICIRENIRNNQNTKPYEIVVSSYEHIQSMYVAVNIKEVEDYLKTINYSKKADLIKYLSQYNTVSSKITGSTGDGINWEE